MNATRVEVNGKKAIMHKTCQNSLLSDSSEEDI
jgi:hypothetical protein